MTNAFRTNESDKLDFGRGTDEKRKKQNPFERYGKATLSITILCLVFPDSTSVGASAGIFGMIGIICMMWLKKDTVCHENLSKGERVYLIIFSALSLLLGWESFITHFSAFVFGAVAGLVLCRKPKCE